MKLYRGLGLTLAQQIVSGKEPIAPTSNGEFGNGSYYWKDDLPAGIMSALQYYGQKEGGWAVIEIEFGKTDIKTTFPILNFKDNGKGKNYDESTKTALRPVVVPEFGPDIAVNLTFSEFRDINAAPAEYALHGEKHTMAWAHYGIIAGPCARAPLDTNLVQVKFAGAGIDALNTCGKKIVMQGAPLNDTTFKRVSKWKLEARNTSFNQYFVGRNTVNLVIG